MKLFEKEHHLLPEDHKYTADRFFKPFWPMEQKIYYSNKERQQRPLDGSSDDIEDYPGFEDNDFVGDDVNENMNPNDINGGGELVNDDTGVKFSEDIEPAG